LAHTDEHGGDPNESGQPGVNHLYFLFRCLLLLGGGRLRLLAGGRLRTRSPAEHSQEHAGYQQVVAPFQLSEGRGIFSSALNRSGPVNRFGPITPSQVRQLRVSAKVMRNSSPLRVSVQNGQLKLSRSGRDRRSRRTNLRSRLSATPWTPCFARDPPWRDQRCARVASGVPLRCFTAHS
jgi:hypothetical protein